MNAVEKGNLVRSAAQTLLDHDAAGRKCDPLTLEWARRIVAQNPRPIEMPEADEKGIEL